MACSFKNFINFIPRVVQTTALQRVVRQKNFTVCSLRHFSLTCGAFNNNNTTKCHEKFRPKTALILTKFSRYEFEKKRHRDLTEDELKKNLADRGSDYSSLIHHHNTHVMHRKLVIETLEKNGIETKLVDRFDYTDENIEWADVIFTAGGDGTFLMAASKILDRDKLVIGINSDPSRSVGYLCLPAHFTANFPKALRKLLNGQFKWIWRQRIRITMTGKNAFDPPIELHNQQLQYPEYRFIDCYQEEVMNKSGNSPESNNSDSVVEGPIRSRLPVRALNEVFIGESLSSRTSYYELSVDGSEYVKQRSSGFTICTGTGSTSWHLNSNKVTCQDIRELLNIIHNITGQSINVDGRKISNITDTFNGSLIFEPSELRMAYTIRDQQLYGMKDVIQPRGFANKIQVKSRCFDACLVIDGGLSFVFNDGATAELKILAEDALKTISLCDEDFTKTSS